MTQSKQPLKPFEVLMDELPVQLYVQSARARVDQQLGATQSQSYGNADVNYTWCT
jgi:hypothetical protein